MGECVSDVGCERGSVCQWAMVWASACECWRVRVSVGECV